VVQREFYITQWRHLAKDNKIERERERERDVYVTDRINAAGALMRTDAHHGSLADHSVTESFVSATSNHQYITTIYNSTLPYMIRYRTIPQDTLYNKSCVPYTQGEI